MAPGIKALKDQIAGLSDAELERFAEWFYRLREQRSYQKRRRTHQGIPHKNVLKAFTRQHGKVPWIPQASMAATMVQGFYLKHRIKGCDPDEGEDVLMLEWGPASKTEFRLAYVREIGPPAQPGHRAEIWHLTLEMRLPMSPQLGQLKSGVKSFQTLKQVDVEFSEFARTSRVGKATRKLKPSQVTVTYENVE